MTKSHTNADFDAANQEQGEPVLWAAKESMFMWGSSDESGHPYHIICKGKKVKSHQIPLYTTPQQRKPLTDEQQKNAARYQWLRNPTTDVSLVLDKRTEWVEPDDSVAGVGGYWMYEYRAGEELDAAIDAAIEAAHGIKE